MWFDRAGIGVIAHRGASAGAPENTLAAFLLALEQGADAIELDVKLTKDEHVVVIHDATVDRTTNGSGKVSGLSLCSIKELDAGSHFSMSYHSEKVPILDEVFDVVGQNLFINIELTNYTTPFDGLVVKVIECIRRHNLGDKVWLSSFYPRNLRIALAIAPELKMGLLAWPGWKGAWSRHIGKKGDYFAIHPFFRDINEMNIKDFHENNKMVMSWTVNDPADISAMIEIGVDGIFTDHPLSALLLLGRAS